MVETIIIKSRLEKQNAEVKNGLNWLTIRSNGTVLCTQIYTSIIMS
jgi:hypothetical protein